MFKPFYVHINPFSQVRKQDIKRLKVRGATVFVRPNEKDEKTVLISATFCSKKDAFCKATGRAEAEKEKIIIINKRDVPKCVAEVEAYVYNDAEKYRGFIDQHMHLLKNFV